MHHVYREANGCADILVKQGTRQQPLVCVYSTCPSFVTVAYIRDLTGLEETKKVQQKTNRKPNNILK